MLFDKTELIAQQSETAEVNLGVIDKDLNELWEDNQYAIEEKVDSYGMVFQRIDAEVKTLNELKAKVLTKFQEAIDRQLSIAERLKTRLHFFAKGNPLRGKLFSFHPFNSITREIKDLGLLEDSELDYTVKMKGNIWKKLLSESSIPLDEYLDYSIKKISANVSSLPEGHKAVISSVRPSIRIT